eukprot:g9254.t1
MTHAYKFDEMYNRVVLRCASIRRVTSSSKKKSSDKKKVSRNSQGQDNTNRKTRILCLHGYEQSKESFRKKTGALRRAGKSHVAEFVFLDAPHESLPRDDSNSSEGKAWYLPAISKDKKSSSTFFEDDSQGASSGGSRSWNLPLDESTWTCSLAHIGKCFKEQGPFDGILGFSQGAATTAALCRLQLEDSKDPYLSSIKFQFAIMISGFIPSHGLYIGDSKLDETTILNGKFDTLHIFGSSDEIINPKRSKALMNYFAESDTREMVHECMHIEHNGGHLVPSDKHVRDAFKEFLGRRRKK